MGESGSLPVAVRVAYFTMEYPRATDTFIQREVAALRSLGVEVETFAARRPGDEHMVGLSQKRERETTGYILPASPGRIMRAHGSLLVQNPKRWFSAMMLAHKTARPGMRGRLYQLFYFLEAGVLAKEVADSGIDHVHAHFGDAAATVAMLAADLVDLPFSFTLHGPGVFFDANVWRLDAKIERSAFVSCISWFARSQAQLLSSEEAAPKLHIVHCGVDANVYEQPPESILAQDSAGDVDGKLAGEGEEKPVRLAFVGRLDHVKGLTVLLDALRLASAEPGSALALTIVGDGPSRASFEHYARDLVSTEASATASTEASATASTEASTETSINFVGYQGQQEVADLLRASDIFVLPSFAEGVPVSLMEASAAGLPVIATQVGGVSELVGENETGFIVPPGDAEALADRISLLANDSELRERLGSAGRQRVKEDFDSSTEAARLASLFLASSLARVSDNAVGAVLAVRPEPLDRQTAELG